MSGSVLRSWSEAWERLLYLQEKFPAKGRILATRLPEGWTYSAELHPCIDCNPPRLVEREVRETTGTVYYCKKHEKLWNGLRERLGAIVYRDGSYAFEEGLI